MHNQSIIQCQKIMNISFSIFSTIRASSDRFYLTGYGIDSSAYYTMMDITFGSSQINWGVSMKSLSNISFTSYINGAALSTDKSKVYVIIPFGKLSGTNKNSNSTYTIDLNLYFIILKWILKETFIDLK